jgi:hypothetical protein
MLLDITFNLYIISLYILSNLLFFIYILMIYYYNTLTCNGLPLT